MMFRRIALTFSYIALLIVLLPHTAWMFRAFEPEGSWGTILGVAAAAAFELTIAALTHALAKQIAHVSIVDKTLLQRLKEELLNIPSFLLIFVVLVSTIANWTHALYFADRELFAIFNSDYEWANVVIVVFYAIIFGGSLPVCSFGYAYILSSLYKGKELVETGALTNDEEAWLIYLDLLNHNGSGPITPGQLARAANISEDKAASIIQMR